MQQGKCENKVVKKKQSFKQLAFCLAFRFTVSLSVCVQTSHKLGVLSVCNGVCTNVSFLLLFFFFPTIRVDELEERGAGFGPEAPTRQEPGR